MMAATIQLQFSLKHMASALLGGSTTILSGTFGLRPPSSLSGIIGVRKSHASPLPTPPIIPDCHFKMAATIQLQFPLKHMASALMGGKRNNTLRNVRTASSVFPIWNNWCAEKSRFASTYTTNYSR